MNRRLRLLAALNLLAVPLAIACGSDAADTNGANENGDGGGNGNGNGGNEFGGNGSTDGGSDGSSENTDGAACSAPIDMYIMFDRSGSMGSNCNIGDTTNSKWCRSINALSGYFSSAGASGQAAALQFFPIEGHTSALCGTGAKYDTPALPTGSPPFTNLPSKAFDSLLNATKPGGGGGGGGFGGGGKGGTPTEAAIRGMTTFTDANRRGGHVTIGILITDGDPNGCDENLTHLSALLQAHNTATQIRTYVIGMEGANFDNLEKIAQGGNAPEHPSTVGAITNACGNGKKTCRHWNVGNGDPTVFATALAAIQESADGCKPGGGYVNPVK